MKFELLDYYLNIDREKVRMYYKGAFNESILSAVSQEIRERFVEQDPVASKKLFAIFLELAQNISFYSAEINQWKVEESKPGVGTFLISEEEDGYIFTTANIIVNENAIEIVDKCKKINSLDKEGLREFKRELRNMPSKNQGHASGNIGLVQVALKAENPLRVELVRINETLAFFILSVKINKQIDSKDIEA